MFENIINLVKDHTKDFVGGNNEIPEDKKESVIDVITSSFGSSIKNQLTPSNIPGLMQMLSGSSSSQNQMISNIQGTISNALVQRVGLNSTLAATIASTIVPMVISTLTKRVKDPNDKEFDLGNIIDSVTGGEKSKGLLDTIEGFFKK